MSHALDVDSFDVSRFNREAKPLNSYRKYWAARFGTAPFLPMSRDEMAQLGWDSCDIVLVTGTPTWTTPASAWP